MDQKIEWRTLIRLIVILSFFGESTPAVYQVGVGRADVTGPSTEVTFMGYAKLGQFGCGIHLRQYARAFIFDDGTTRATFVSIDSCMMNHGVKKFVLQQLEEKYNGTYTKDNLVLSGTHTHSGPGGFLMDVMLDIPNLGFYKPTFDVLVDGIVRAIERAHESVTNARIYLSNSTIEDANINRSPASYEYNPEDEKNEHEANTDKEIVQLRIVRDEDNVTIGAINWFAVHPTSMNNTNCLVSSDNVGYASILLETTVEPKSLPGQTTFVGAFASSNLGDVSPNIKGPHCLNTGKPCEVVNSTCDGDAQQCIAFGPGDDMFESTEIIATRIFNKGYALLQEEEGSATEVAGDVRFIHQFVSMPDKKVLYQDSDRKVREVSGCLPAMGYGFAGGTTDGPGAFDFTQATNSSNAFWNVVRDFIFPPTKADIACHAPKPILIMSGGISLPYEWQPEVVATQVIKIGNVIIAAVPGEFTTMSGRRLRNAVREAAIANGAGDDTRVILAGLSNVYTNYIATPEEYQLQRYEGASTIFGPHTLTIYLSQYANLTESLMKDEGVEEGPSPFEFPEPEELMSLITPVVYDTSGWFNSFGDCSQQPPATAKVGDEVSAKFISGNPRNDLMTEKTFLTVEKQTDDGWEVIATDSSWETKFIWTRIDGIVGSSQVEIVWKIKDGTEPGTYRIQHFGAYKYILGGVYPYQGSSRTFTVTAE